MSEVQRYEAQLSGKPSWELRKTIKEEELRSDKALVRVAHEAQLQVQRNRAISYVAQDAMQGVAFLSEMEARLSTLSPIATTRLQVIADSAAMAMAQTVANTYMKVS